MKELLRWTGRVSDLAGGLSVRRLLPDAQRRAVGPFVFFDHFGPVSLPAEVDSDVGPHPHIGLATVTWLFEGSFLHRDSLGTVQTITPGAVNWMSAGQGIVHSERVPDAQRGQVRRLHGLQLWVALPPAWEASAPSFQHVPAADLPDVTLALAPGPGPDGEDSPREAAAASVGARVRVLVGEAFGVRSPVRTASPTLYLDVQLPAGALWRLPPLAPEMAVYSPELPLSLDGQALAAQQMAALPVDRAVELAAGAQGAHFVLIGGAPLERPVRLWWNFVASDRERLAEAARRWAEGGFTPIPGDPVGIPAPPWRE